MKSYQILQKDLPTINLDIKELKLLVLTAVDQLQTHLMMFSVIFSEIFLEGEILFPDLEDPTEAQT